MREQRAEYPENDEDDARHLAQDSRGTRGPSVRPTVTPSAETVHSASVAPMNTDQRASKRATKAALPICVASPISARKTRPSAVRYSRRSDGFGCSSPSGSSRNSSTRPKSTNTPAAVQRTAAAGSRASSVPRPMAMSSCARNAVHAPSSTASGRPRAASSSTA